MSELPEEVWTALFPFCGLGAGARGFVDARVMVRGRTLRFRSIGGIDNDPLACADFEALTRSPALCADMAKLTSAELREFAGARSPDCVFLSAPCLPSHEEVLTPSGPRRIEHIRANDLVLTHKGRFRRVLKVGTHVYDGTIYGLRLNGTVDTREFTADHPIWRRRVTRGKDRKRALSEPEFVSAEHLRIGDRVGFPVPIEREGTAADFVEGLGDPQLVTKGGQVVGRYRKPEHVARLERVVDLREKARWIQLWFLLGVYIGDGFRGATKHETNFCVGAEGGDLDVRVRQNLDVLGIGYSVDRDGGPTNVKVRARSKHLSMIAEAFGDGAASKRLPEELFSLESRLIDALLDGYQASDGSAQPRRMQGREELQARWRIASVSLPLLRGFQRLLLRRRQFTAIHVAWPGGPQTIMGREVQTLPRWELSALLSPKKRTVHEFIGDHVWIRIRDIKARRTSEPVWNLEVDEDNTFCAPLIATHNCKGFSGLLSAKAARATKYQAMNRLALDWIELMLSTWDVPPKLVLFENVPRIASRGRNLLERVKKLLRAAGYLFHAGSHDCGELGGLAQHRTRYLLVARHPDRCAPLLYQPPPQRVRACGEVLGELPLPEDASAGPMHRLPKLSWLNWVRLALIPAGGDWRDLEGVLKEGQARREVHRRHRVEDWTYPSATVAGSGSNGPSAVADPRVDEYRGPYGVQPWSEPSGVVTGSAAPSRGVFSVADPRPFGNVERVTSWESPVGTITSSPAPSSGAGAVADPRIQLGACKANSHHNKYRVEEWHKPAHTVIGATRVGSGAPAVADPRLLNKEAYPHSYGVLRWDEPSSTIAGGTQVGQGAYSVADLRFGARFYAGTYGVLGWEEAAATITGRARVDTGRFAVADPRKAPDRLPMIVAADGTWHRPLTTLELAALQGIPTTIDGKPLVLAGEASGKWRERIGNAVPPPAARAIAEQMLVCLSAAGAGTWSLSGDGSVWVESNTESAPIQ